MGVVTLFGWIWLGAECIANSGFAFGFFLLNIFNMQMVKSGCEAYGYREPTVYVVNFFQYLMCISACVSFQLMIGRLVID